MGKGPKIPVMSESEIEISFPNLRTGKYTITSRSSVEYNCIAWAAGDIETWWWPDPNSQYFWPDDVPRHESLDAFKIAFEKLGYVECDDYAYEEDFEKIAIYVDSNSKPTHASRQLSPGIWTSKLGQIEDIEHPFNGLDGSLYGSIALIMRRPK